MNNLAYDTYSQNNISIESPQKLIEMLYEGVLKFSSYSIKAIQMQNVEKKVHWIKKTTAIFAELIECLDLKNEGSIAPYLKGLYTHQIALLTKANLENNSEYIQTVINVTKGLLDAWREETKL